MAMASSNGPGRRDTEIIARWAALKTVAHHLVGERKQVIEIPVDVEQSEGLRVNTELSPCPHLEELVESPDSARKRHESVGLVGHERLALVHGAHDMELREARVGQLAFLQLRWDHPDHLAAPSQDGVRENAHQAHACAAVHQADAAPHQFMAERFRRRAKLSSEPAFDPQYTAIRIRPRKLTRRQGLVRYLRPVLTAAVTGLSLGFGMAPAGRTDLAAVRLARCATVCWSASPSAAVPRSSISVTWHSVWLGVARLVTVPWLRPVLGLVGAGVLAVIGGRTLWSAFRVRAGGEADDEVGSARVAFRTAIAATASNPLTIASRAAAFAAASGLCLVEGPGPAALLVAAVGVGSLLWFTLLSCVAGWLGRRTGSRVLRGVDALSGIAVLSFAGVLGWRSVRGD